jgi:FO synthase
VVAIAEAGQRQECKEVLFTLGERPEERYPIARQWLAERGYHSTLDYLRAVSIKVIEETGLLPHLNPGVMTWEDMARLKHVSVSMGLMLETSSERLSRKGGPHFGSPDKVPDVRLRTIEAAGRLSIPFTTGIQVGIGENPRERAASLFAIRSLHQKYRHIQEVIVQNFKAKPGTAMRQAPEPSEEEFLATVAAARVVFGPYVNVQAPPNLSDPHYPRLTDAGINDWGGVSPVTIDHVNPEAPWPKFGDLERRTAEKGYTLRERLAIYPRLRAQARPLDRRENAGTDPETGRSGRAGRARHQARAHAMAGPQGPVEAQDHRPDLRQGAGDWLTCRRPGRLRELRLHPRHTGLG